MSGDGSSAEIDPVVATAMQHLDPEGAVFRADQPNQVASQPKTEPFHRVPGLRADSPYASRVAANLADRPNADPRYDLPSDQLTGKLPQGSILNRAMSTAFTNPQASRGSEETR